MELVSFSEQVPASQRLTLQQQVSSFGKDEIFHPDGERRPTLDDRDASQTAVIFHPRTIQMVRFKKARTEEDTKPEEISIPDEADGDAYSLTPPTAHFLKAGLWLTTSFNWMRPMWHQLSRDRERVR